MTYVIAQPCVDLKDRACIDECPVDCIYEGKRMLYIHPDECVDCGACEPVCPVEAITYEDDLGEKFSVGEIPAELLEQAHEYHHLLIDAIAEQHQLAATEKDVDDRVAKVAEQRGSDPGQVYTSLQKAGRLPEIERSITEDNVFEWLIARNEITTGTNG